MNDDPRRLLWAAFVALCFLLSPLFGGCGGSDPPGPQPPEEPPRICGAAWKSCI